MRAVLWIVLALLLAACGQKPQASKAASPISVESADGPRLALVIGVSRYGASVGALDNPVRDAELVTGALRGQGFAVSMVKDPDRRALTGALNAFTTELENAGRGAVGLIYFAGHGMQVAGVNYILPRDAEPPAGLSADTSTVALENALSDAFVPAERLLKALGRRDDGINILILDACRDNRLVRSIVQKTRSLGEPRSLADKPLEADDMLVAYATGPGEVSYDGEGGNSPYALALAEEIARPGSVGDMFIRVRARVASATQGKQKPLVMQGLQRQFCFAECANSAPTPVSTTSSEGTVPRGPGSTFRDCADCPEMMIVSGGVLPTKDGTKAVEIDPFAVGRYEVTLGEWQAFARATGYATSDWCYGDDQKGLSWRDPGHAQGERYPVVCIGWNDARQYVRWLSRRAGKRYWLPSSTQWQWAADLDPAAGRRRGPIARVGSAAPNKYGLHDMEGNADEWLGECQDLSCLFAPDLGKFQSTMESNSLGLRVATSP